MEQAKIAIIGGSGLYELFDRPTEVEINTPYGRPSAPIQLKSQNGRQVAFLPRHGRNHEFAPHLINYRANIYALKSLGFEVIVGLNCAGSLAPNIHPGELVICDDLVDYTTGRNDTFVQKGELICLGMENVFSPSVRSALLQAALQTGLTAHESSTAAVINGPRLSTRAESRRYSQQGCHIVNMTLYPECYLARELRIAYASATLITDYDAGVPDVKMMSLPEMASCFQANAWKQRELISSFLEIPELPFDREIKENHNRAIVNGNFFGEQ